MEVSEILGRFSPKKDGLVHYADFLRYCDPPADVKDSLHKIREYLSKAEKTRGMVIRMWQ